MIRYKYKALQDNTKIIEGEIYAQNLREAREQIRKLGFVPTKIYTEDVQLPVEKNFYSNTSIKHLSLVQKIDFTSQLETLLSAGIPILEVLQNIENNSADDKLKKISLDIRLAIMSDLTFAQALDKLYGKLFGPVYIGLVKTGEDSGELDAALRRMLVILRKQLEIKDKIVNASVYPGILVLMMIGLLILFAKFVFPKFVGMMAFNGAELPCLAQFIMGFFSFVSNFWWLILIFIAAGSYVVINLCKNTGIKKKLDDIVLKIPVLSEFVTYVNLSNFMTVMQISYDAGVPIMTGIELANKTVGNHNIKSKISNSLSLVRTGKSLSEAFSETMAIPQALISMISAGEKSGTLGKMFHDCADVIDRKVNIVLETMTKLFEPFIILIIGGFVLLIVVAFVQAYVSMLGSLI